MSPRRRAPSSRSRQVQRTQHSSRSLLRSLRTLAQSQRARPRVRATRRPWARLGRSSPRQAQNLWERAAKPGGAQHCASDPALGLFPQEMQRRTGVSVADRTLAVSSWGTCRAGRGTGAHRRRHRGSDPSLHRDLGGAGRREDSTRAGGGRQGSGAKAPSGGSHGYRGCREHPLRRRRPSPPAGQRRRDGPVGAAADDGGVDGSPRRESPVGTRGRRRPPPRQWLGRARPSASSYRWRVRRGDSAERGAGAGRDCRSLEGWPRPSRRGTGPGGRRGGRDGDGRAERERRGRDPASAAGGQRPQSPLPPRAPARAGCGLVPSTTPKGSGVGAVRSTSEAGCASWSDSA